MPAIENRLAPVFALHRLWRYDDPKAFLREIGSSIRGAVTFSGAAPFSAEIFALLPRLEIVANMGAGYDSIDVAEAERRGVIVTNAGGVNALDVAEHAIGLILTVARDIIEADRYLRAGRWKAEGRMPLGRRLSGRSLGILGLGNIGREIARLADGFGMPVHYHNRRRVAGVPYEYRDTPEALARSVDVLVIAAPGGPDTWHLVDRSVIAALGPSGILVNVGRGSIVDHSALTEALAEGRLGGAGLDVFEDEPNIPEHLLSFRNVVLQPHIAGATREGVEAAIDAVVGNMAGYFAGGPVNHRVV